MIQSLGFERLVAAFNRFPGIGRKSASRLAWHLISQQNNFALELAEIIKQSAELFCVCDKCYMLSESNPCPVCSSPERDVDQLCVVESSADVLL
ncbi:MAG: recombination protein RecR, partial [Candidatus Cloacimonadaceae bacterium]|nr:recombination protein RecR [Candidatus Cloacimonadaceae bacterium]